MYINNVDDPRFGWDRFRRKQLENIATIEKIVFKYGSPATLLRVLLQDVDPNKYQQLIYSDALHGHIGEQRPPNLEEEVRLLVEEVDFNTMGLEELQKECDLQNIKYHHRNKESALRAKLNDHAA